ncbi:MAG: 3'-5' exonuclease [Gallionella sp.]|jgi:DNA polymerase-3 subunit epsilon|nr:3'-5' exonuclease [Gallionella sp.]
MNWLERVRGHKLKLSDRQSARLKAWRDLPRPGTPIRLDNARMVVMDVETTGLNLTQDKLIAIGAVAIVNGKIALEDSFELVLQQASSSSKKNILIHGISGQAQTEGRAPAEGLLAFLEYLQNDPLIAFHVTFDETMLCRAMRQHLGFVFKHEWLDLAYVTPGLYPQLASTFRALDDWLEHFHIRNYARHNALADALSTAQLFMVVSQTARCKDIVDYPSLRRVEQAQRWLDTH